MLPTPARVYVWIEHTSAVAAGDDFHPNALSFYLLV